MRKAPAILLLCLLTLAACSERAGEPRTTTSPTVSDLPEATLETTGPAEKTATKTPERESPPEYGYTYGQPSGNLAVDGTGNLPGSRPFDIRLGGEPAWVAGVPFGSGVAWVAVLEDGRVEAFRLDESGKARRVPITPERLTPGEPPLVEARGDSLKLVTSRNERASTLTHPAPVGEDRLLGVEESGELFVEGGAFVSDPPVETLPDARLAQGPDGAVAALSAPTTEYEHGVLGDGIEAGGITILDGSLEVAGRIRPATGGVFEEVSPLWFGEGLLAVTESTAAEGARISVYSSSGDLAAAGPAMGQPFKWRHLLATGPFGPDGGTEIAAVRTPHVEPRVEFYEVDGQNGALRLAATLPGYTSHRINTRNLDTARAGDFDGDGGWELLVPNDSYTELAAIRREKDGARVAWKLPAGGVISTNLASATNSEGRASIAAGRADGILRIWP